MTVDSNHLPQVAKPKHRTAPITASLTHVPNYPKKLVIYQLPASPFWWMRYYTDGKILRRSTKTTNKKHAIAAAKEFYDEINNRKFTGQALSASKDTSFEHCAHAAMEMQLARVTRGELTKMVHENDEWRLKKHVLPFFIKYDIGKIDFFALELFLRKISEDKKIGKTTAIAYMGIVKKVLSYALKRGLIKALPVYPKIKKEDSPRGWFTTREYRRVWNAAKRLIGVEYEIRAVDNDKDDDEDAHHIIYPKADLKKGEQKLGKPIRNITITNDLYNLIVFMVNSFVRPTDIKVLKHKHVEIIRNDNTYLRLSLPKTKKHDKPIVTMKWAVVVYERIRDYYKAQGLAKPDDYVFMPQQRNRDYALKDLQRQFSVVLNDVGLKESATGENRSLYSLRHTCITYRFLYGEGIDILTIARNARTSPEMIDRFYVKHLEGEMNIAAIQSKRRKKNFTKAVEETTKEVKESEGSKEN
jgi:hypothetical protein